VDHKKRGGKGEEDKWCGGVSHSCFRGKGIGGGQYQLQGCGGRGRKESYLQKFELGRKGNFCAGGIRRYLNKQRRKKRLLEETLAQKKKE